MKRAFIFAWIVTMATAVQCSAQTPAGRASENQQERQLFKLEHVQSTDLANSLSKSFSEVNSHGNAVVSIVPMPSYNGLLISAPAETMKEISKLLSELDRETPSVSVDVWFVDLQPDAAKHGDAHQASTPAEFLPSGRRSVVLEKLHQLEKEGKVSVVNHLQLTCLENQEGFLQQGERRPNLASAGTTSTGRSLAANSQNVGTIIHLQPRVSAGNQIVMALDAEKTSPAAGAKKAKSDHETENTDRADSHGVTTVATVGQTTIQMASGDIVSFSGITSSTNDAPGSYQVLVSAEVVPPPSSAAKK